MTQRPPANWQRRIVVIMSLLTGLGAALALLSCGLVYWFETSIYPEAKHIASNTGSNGLIQLNSGGYRWEAASVTFFESTDTPDKIIKWYTPRYKIKRYSLGPLTVDFTADEVHYTPPILYRIGTNISVALEFGRH